jgi:hypothetical protein
MTRFGRLVILAALVLGLAGAATAAEVTGTWTAEIETQIGVQKYVFKLKAEGEKLTGTATGERMGKKDEVVITDGTVKGDKVTFVEKLPFEGQELIIKYTGTVAGDEIKLTRDVAELITESFVAKRKKE